MSKKKIIIITLISIVVLWVAYTLYGVDKAFEKYENDDQYYNK